MVCFVLEVGMYQPGEVILPARTGLAVRVYTCT